MIQPIKQEINVHQKIHYRPPLRGPLGFELGCVFPFKTVNLSTFQSDTRFLEFQGIGKNSASHRFVRLYVSAKYQLRSLCPVSNTQRRPRLQKRRKWWKKGVLGGYGPLNPPLWNIKGKLAYYWLFYVKLVKKNLGWARSPENSGNPLSDKVATS